MPRKIFTPLESNPRTCPQVVSVTGGPPDDFVAANRLGASSAAVEAVFKKSRRGVGRTVESIELREFIRGPPVQTVELYAFSATDSIRSTLLRQRLLPREFVLERFFLLVDVRLETRRIDERILPIFPQLGILLIQIVETPVRRQENVDVHFPKRREAAHVVVSDGRIILVVHQNVSRIPADAPQNDDVVSLG